MKSTKRDENVDVYPCLKRSTRDNIVVLFKNEGCGTVVFSGEESYPLGSTGAWTMAFFVPYYGEIKLSN